MLPATHKMGRKNGDFRTRSQLLETEFILITMPLMCPSLPTGGLADGCLAGLLRHHFSAESQPGLSCLLGFQA